MVVTVDGIARGIRRIFPIAVFVVPFGIAFGAAAITVMSLPWMPAGWNATWAMIAGMAVAALWTRFLSM